MLADARQNPASRDSAVTQFGTGTASDPLAAQPLFAAPLVFGLAALASLWLLSSLHPDYGYFLDEINYRTCARRP